MLPRFPRGVDVSGWGEPGPARIRVQRYLPLRVFGVFGVWFDEAVAPGTQQDPVAQFRFPALMPRNDVMALARRGGCVAVGERAALIPSDKCGPQPLGEQPMWLAHVKDLRLAAQDDGDDVGVAGESAGLARGDGLSVVEDGGGSDTGGEGGGGW